MAGQGRPTLYTVEIADRICAELAGGNSLAGICRAADMPSQATVHGWVTEDRDGFSERYTRAREVQALRWADELVEIADDGSNDTYTADGAEKVNHDHIQRSKLRVDTRKWLLSKMLPKIYGDRVFNEHRITDVSQMTREEAERELDLLRAGTGNPAPPAPP